MTSGRWPCAAGLYEAGDFSEPAASLPPLSEVMIRATGGRLARPAWVGRGGWYTLRFAPGELAITPHAPVSP